MLGGRLMPLPVSKGATSKEEIGITPCRINTKWWFEEGKRKSREYSGKTVFGVSEAPGALVKANPVAGNVFLIFEFSDTLSALFK